MAGVDLVTLAAMLGHSRVQMVMRYAHPTEKHQFNAMKKVQTFVAGGLKNREASFRVESKGKKDSTPFTIPFNRKNY